MGVGLGEQVSGTRPGLGAVGGKFRTRWSWRGHRCVEDATQQNKAGEAGRGLLPSSPSLEPAHLCSRRSPPVLGVWGPFLQA